MSDEEDDSVDEPIDETSDKWTYTDKDGDKAFRIFVKEDGIYKFRPKELEEVDEKQDDNADDESGEVIKLKRRIP